MVMIMGTSMQAMIMVMIMGASEHVQGKCFKRISVVSKKNVRVKGFWLKHQAERGVRILGAAGDPRQSQR